MLTVVLISVALVIFVTGNAIRVVKTLRMPAHLRWELYPIPKGPLQRQRYGGSYFEESEWWTKPADTGHQSELIFVLKEVVLLRGVWENFRALWPWSWLLHWGLYLYLLATLFSVAGVWLRTNPGSILHAAVVHGYQVACLCGLVGAMGLVVMRSFHPRLRAFTTRIGMFDLLLLASIFATGLLVIDAGAIRLGNMIRDLPRLPMPPGGHPVIWQVHMALVAFFLAYFPFTHMTHAYMKYFTWHDVRWYDTPSSRDPRAAKAIAVNLERQSSWVAAHIAAGRTTTWSEVVADPNRNGAGKRA